ncbi:MAG: hypothetical protein IAG13_38440 [Deltaproteobacteria bacterium]|nr:hypothetical protein [Nannocystaceae bacterium]
MRINVETFMALVVMIGAGGAIAAAVVTSGSDDGEAPAAKQEPEKVVEEKAPAPVPVIPPAAKPTVPPAEPAERFTSTILEPIPDDPVEAAEPVVPGPEFEGG